MKRRNKVLALLLAITMTFTYMPMLAFAESETTDEDQQSIAVEAAEEAEKVDSIENESTEPELVVTEENADNQADEEQLQADPAIEEDPQSEDEQTEPISKLNLSESKTITLQPDEERVLSTFTYDGSSIVYAYAEILADVNTSEEYEFFLSIDEKDGPDTEFDTLPVTSVDFKWPGFVFADSGSDTYHQYWDSDEPMLGLSEGKEYQIVLMNCTEHAYKMQYKIRTYDSYYESVTIPSEISIDVTEAYKVITAEETDTGNKMPLVVNWDTSDDDIANPYSSECNSAWVWCDMPGSCTLTATMVNGSTATCNVTVTDKTIRLQESSIVMRVGDSFTLQLLNKGSGKIKWSTTKKKVATVSSKGVVKAKGPGTCTIKAKYQGKTYQCSIEVYRELPDYDAYIDDYETRDKWFIVTVTNYGDLPLTIYSAKAKAIDDDYKSWDRKLKLKKGKTLTVKPDQTVDVYFKVVGKKGAWYDYEDYTIEYYMAYNGAKYKATVDCYEEDSSFYLPKSGWYIIGDGIDYLEKDWYCTWNDIEDE